MMTSRRTRSSHIPRCLATDCSDVKRAPIGWRCSRRLTRACQRSGRVLRAPVLIWCSAVEDWSIAVYRIASDWQSVAHWPTVCPLVSGDGRLQLTVLTPVTGDMWQVMNQFFVNLVQSISITPNELSSIQQHNNSVDYCMVRQCIYLNDRLACILIDCWLIGGGRHLPKEMLK